MTQYCSRCGKEIPESAAYCPSCGAPTQGSSDIRAEASVGARSGFDALTKDRQAQDYWLRRLIAFVVDAVIVFGFLGVVIAAVALPAFITSQFLPGIAVPIFGFGIGVLSVLSGVVFVLYFTFSEALYGASIGKGLMALRVHADDGKNPTIVNSFIRNVSKIYWVLLLLDVVIGLALETDYKMKFSDKFVRAIVTPK